MTPCCLHGRYLNQRSSNFSTFGTPASRNHYKRHYIEAIAVGKGFDWISFGVFPKATRTTYVILIALHTMHTVLMQPPSGRPPPNPRVRLLALFLLQGVMLDFVQTGTAETFAIMVFCYAIVAWAVQSIWGKEPDVEDNGDREDDDPEDTRPYSPSPYKCDTVQVLALIRKQLDAVADGLDLQERRELALRKLEMGSQGGALSLSKIEMSNLNVPLLNCEALRYDCGDVAHRCCTWYVLQAACCS